MTILRALPPERRYRLCWPLFHYAFDAKANRRSRQFGNFKAGFNVHITPILRALIPAGGARPKHANVEISFALPRERSITQHNTKIRWSGYHTTEMSSKMRRSVALGPVKGDPVSIGGSHRSSVAAFPVP